VPDTTLLHGMGKRVGSTSLYHSRQCCVVHKPRSGRTDYTVVASMTHDCSRKLWKRFWVWFKPSKQNSLYSAFHWVANTVYWRATAML